MAPEFSRRGWFQVLFGGLLGWCAGPPKAGAGTAPGVDCLDPLPSSGLTYATYLGGQTTTHVYDAAGRLCASTDGNAHTCTYTYDANGDRA